MITLNILFIVVALVLAFFIFFKLLRSVLKALMFVLFLCLFVVGILGILVYLDVGKVKSSFGNGQTALLTQDGTIVAGFTYSDNTNEVLQSDKLNLMTEDELSAIDDKIKKGTYTGEESLTLIISSSEFYDSTVDLLNGNNVVLDEKMINKIFSCTSKDSCVNTLSEQTPALKKQIAASFDNEQDLKNKLFFNLFTEKTKDSKGKFIITGIKNNNITIYPELTTLKLVKIVPDKIITNMLNKVTNFAGNADNTSE